MTTGPTNALKMATTIRKRRAASREARSIGISSKPSITNPASASSAAWSKANADPGGHPT